MNVCEYMYVLLIQYMYELLLHGDAAPGHDHDPEAPSSVPGRTHLSD
eukprot:SAG31_NODE_283_length_18512_cov_19.352414_17_plen_47_part_00